MRTPYEQALLEMRQGLKETEETLRLSPCVSLHLYKEINKFKKLADSELIAYRRGIKLMDEDLVKTL